MGGCWLTALATRADLDPRARPYKPYGGARDLFRCRDPEVLIEGPAGTGKSVAVLGKAILVVANYPGARILFVRKTRQSMSETILQLWEDHVLPEGSAVAHGASRAFRLKYTFGNGSEIILGGLDKVERIMSGEFDMICLFEATEATLDDWEKLLSRLRHGALRFPKPKIVRWEEDGVVHEKKVYNWHQAVAECNPKHPAHWLNHRPKQTVIDHITNKPRPKMTRLLSRHADNPALPDGYVEHTLATLTGVRRARLYEGKWVAAEGAVYDTFDAAVHVIDRFVIPDDWRRIRSVDFGYNNPFVCQWWAIDGDGSMYRYREVYMSCRLVEDHARQILDLSEGTHIELTVSDHAREDRETLHRHGVQTIPANKAIAPGIEAVQSRLRVGEHGKPCIYFMRDSLIERDPKLDELKLPACTEDEFDVYMWHKGQDGKSVKEVPLDKDNHGMDAMRYAVRYVDGDVTLALAVGDGGLAIASGRERGWTQVWSDV